MDTGNFIINIQTEDFYKDIAIDVEKRFDKSNYEVDRPLPTGKEIIGLMKDELERKIMTKFAAIRPKTYSCLTEDDKNDKHVTKKKAKGTRQRVMERVLKFNDYKDCLSNNEIILRQQQRFKSDANNLYTEEVNKTALSSNDDKRLQTFDRITLYPYGTSVGKLYKTEL